MLAINLEKYKAMISFLKKVCSTWLVYRVLQTALLLVTGVFVLFACAQATIPIGPVPITLQTAGLLVIGLTYPRRLLVTVVLFYLVLGVVGVPVFSNYSSGVSVLLGPRGGYLIGCVIAAQVMAYLREKFGEGSWIALALYGFIGLLLVFSLGVAWLAYLMDFPRAIQVGLLPLLVTEFLKVVVVSLTVYQIKKHNNPKSNC